MAVCFILTACAGHAPAVDADAAADSGRSSHSSGIAHRDRPVYVVREAAPRVSVKGDQLLGNPAASIGIVEFSDYQCLYCRDFHRQQFSRLRKEYIDTGVVQFIHKDLPLRRHPQAYSAAIAAHCAGAQARFWDMHGALYAHQGRLGRELYAELARGLGLDMTEFDACFENQVPGEGIARDMATAGRFGFTGTPSFLIGILEGDTLVVKYQSRGVPDFGIFAQEIEKLRNR